jgi:hypothetical protein
VEFGSNRPGSVLRRAMELDDDSVECRDEVTAADVERFGASLSSEQRAQVVSFNTDIVKFTAWPELVRLFPNLDEVWARQCGLVEFPLALCALPNLNTLYLPGNNFVEVPSEVSQLQPLKYCYLFSCPQLQRLPSSMSTLTTLSQLQLKGCTKLPKEFNAPFLGVDVVRGVLVKISRHFVRFERCRAACVTLIGLRQFKRHTILLSQPVDVTVLVAKFLWQARHEWPVV